MSTDTPLWLRDLRIGETLYILLVCLEWKAAQLEGLKEDFFFLWCSVVEETLFWPPVTLNGVS